MHCERAIVHSRGGSSFAQSPVAGSNNALQGDGGAEHQPYRPELYKCRASVSRSRDKIGAKISIVPPVTCPLPPHALAPRKQQSLM